MCVHSELRKIALASIINNIAQTLLKQHVHMQFHQKLFVLSASQSGLDYLK